MRLAGQRGQRAGDLVTPRLLAGSVRVAAIFPGSGVPQVGAAVGVVGGQGAARPERYRGHAAAAIAAISVREERTYSPDSGT
jgi:hypothetical protein